MTPSMSTAALSSGTATQVAETWPTDMKLEVVVLAVFNQRPSGL
jgi:hypothetical protein